MTHAEKLICNFAANWLDDNFDKITYDLSRSDLPTDKVDLIRMVGRDPQDAMWVLTELPYWDKGLTKPDITVFEGELYKVLKIHSKYIRVEYKNFKWELQSVKPKTKTVTYYE